MDERLAWLVSDIKRLYKDAKVFLFGSRARGKATEDSDYDLIVVSKEFAKTDFVDRAGKIWRSTDAPIGADLLCYTPREFKRISKESIVVSDAMEYAIPL